MTREPIGLAAGDAFLDYIRELRQTWQPDEVLVAKHAPSRVSRGLITNK